jgi:RNA polymerase sigma-70 factor (ECF subfamily)
MDSAVAEHALIDAVAAGDVGAFEQLFRLYERRVYQYILGFVRDAAVAEEVAADTLLTVWHGASRFEKSSRVSTWILGIARHKAIDAVRRITRQARTGLLEEAEELPTPAPGPLDAAHDYSVEQLTRRAIQRLSAEHREVLYLAFYADVPYEQIAILLEVPQNTVKTRVYYAKQKLREHLERLSPVEVVR